MKGNLCPLCDCTAVTLCKQLSVKHLKLNRKTLVQVHMKCISTIPIIPKSRCSTTQQNTLEDFHIALHFSTRITRLQQLLTSFGAVTHGCFYSSSMCAVPTKTHVTRSGEPYHCLTPRLHSQQNVPFNIWQQKKKQFSFFLEHSHIFVLSLVK